MRLTHIFCLSVQLYLCNLWHQLVQGVQVSTMMQFANPFSNQGQLGPGVDLSQGPVFLGGMLDLDFSPLQKLVQSLSPDSEKSKPDDSEKAEESGKKKEPSRPRRRTTTTTTTRRPASGFKKKLPGFLRRKKRPGNKRRPSRLDGNRKNFESENDYEYEDDDYDEVSVRKPFRKHVAKTLPPPPRRLSPPLPPSPMQPHPSYLHPPPPPPPEMYHHHPPPPPPVVALPPPPPQPFYHLQPPPMPHEYPPYRPGGRPKSAKRKPLSTKRRPNKGKPSFSGLNDDDDDEPADQTLNIDLPSEILEMLGMGKKPNRDSGLIGDSLGDTIGGVADLVDNFSFHTLAKKLAKRAIKSFVYRLVPGAKIFKRVAEKGCKEVQDFGLNDSILLPLGMAVTLHPLLMPLVPYLLLTLGSIKAIESATCFVSLLK